MDVSAPILRLRRVVEAVIAAAVLCALSIVLVGHDPARGRHAPDPARAVPVALHGPAQAGHTL